jgi:hypothetical protein
LFDVDVDINIDDGAYEAPGEQLFLYFRQRASVVFQMDWNPMVK